MDISEVAKIKAYTLKLFPEAVFYEYDYGLTLSVTNSKNEKVFFLTRCLRPERDGYTGYYIIAKDQIHQIVNQLKNVHPDHNKT